MFSKKAIKVDEIFTGDLTVSVKLSVKILSNVVAFLENTNFRQNIYAHNTVSFTKKKFAFCSPFKNIYGKKNQDWLFKCDEQDVMPVHQSSIPKTFFKKPKDP